MGLLSEFAQCEQKALMSALEESALYQLHDAWLSYLQELGDMVAYRQPVQSLQELVGQVNLITGEMRELMQLQDNAFSWLSQMLKAGRGEKGKTYCLDNPEEKDRKKITK